MLDLKKTMRGWSNGERLVALALFVAATMAIAWRMGFWMGHVYDQPDATTYLDLAAGRPVMLPFASRQLGPLMVRGMVHVWHVSYHAAFLLQGAAALLFFVGVVGFVAVGSGAPRWMLAALTGFWFWSLQWNGLVMPDLLYAALLCVFLLLLRAEMLLAAAVMMFPLMVSRESTLLTLVCFLLAGWRRMKLGEAVTAVAASAAGIAVVKHLTANALPNKEHISPMFYLIAKMPWNLLRNVLGVDVWANLYPTCGIPRWQMAMHLGPLQAVGLCGFSRTIPVRTLAFGLTTFGLLPLLLVRVWGGMRDRDALLKGRGGVMLRFALLYGGVSFVLAPLLGESLGRLYGYSWPIFLVALPVLLGASGANFRWNWSAAAFVALHTALTWLVFWQYFDRLLMTELAGYVAGWWLLRRTFAVNAAERVLEAS